MFSVTRHSSTFKQIIQIQLWTFFEPMEWQSIQINFKLMQSRHNRLYYTYKFARDCNIIYSVEVTLLDTQIGNNINFHEPLTALFMIRFLGEKLWEALSFILPSTGCLFLAFFHLFIINSLSVNPTKWPNIHKQIVWRVVWVCLTILWVWC